MEALDVNTTVPARPRHYDADVADAIEDADFRAVANQSNVVIFPENLTRGTAIEHMSRRIPSNDYGLPLYYLRSDLLDLNLICHQGRTTQDDIDAAAELLAYQDGYPTFQSGSPFWMQMPHEPYTDYLLFKRFIDLDEQEGIRLLASLAQREQVDLQTLKELSLEYFWSSRARAYDLFVVAAEAKKREVRIRKAENSHFTLAGSVLDKIVHKFNDEPDLIDDMNAKDLFDLFEQMVKVQRLSLGLTGQHASSVNPSVNTPGASVEVILRQLTKNSGLSSQSGEGFQNRLAALMSDEGTAMQMQELIVRATGAGSHDVNQ